MLEVVVSSLFPPEYIKIAFTDPGPVTMCKALLPDAVHPANEAEYFRANPDKICVADVGVNDAIELKVSLKMKCVYKKCAD